jgi:hypothetical protein
VYQGQKVYLFRPSLGFLAEAQLKTGDDKKHFLAEVPIKFLGDHTSCKAKDITGKITNLFCIYFLQIDNSYLFNEFVCNLGFFWHEWASLNLE